MAYKTRKRKVKKNVPEGVEQEKEKLKKMYLKV